MQKIVFLIVAAYCCLVQAEYSASDCRELGFIKGQLMCSNCEKLDDFGLETLKWVKKADKYNF